MAHTTAERAVMKLKVGQKYEVGTAGAEKGDIIEIEAVCGQFINYKRLRGNGDKKGRFMAGSVFARELKEYKQHCIVIYKDGAETVALDKTTGKKAVAKCSPQDTYDFYTGAKLAFERLTGTEEKPQHVNCKCSLKPQYYNGYVQFVKAGYKNLMPCGDFTEGKVYEVENGRITDDKGWTGGLGARDVADLSATLGNTFRGLKAVKREAKAGEYVLVVNNNCAAANDYKNGDVLKIIKTGRWTACNKAYYKDEESKFLWAIEYLVLEGYEPPKQYFNGKAVCVKSEIGFTLGKVYEFKDGRMVDDQGTTRPMKPAEPVTTSVGWFKEYFLQLIE